MPLAPRRVLRAFKYAVYFDGVDDFVRIPASSSLDFSSDFTVCAWLAVAELNPRYGGAVDAGRTYVTNWWFLLTSGKTAMQFGLPYTDGSWSTIYFPDVAIGVFKNYCFGVSGSTQFGYLDGSLYYTITFTKTRAVSLRPVDIGRWLDDSSYGKFMLAQLLIYSRALSGSEILWNYQYPDNPIRNGLVLWLKADPNNIKDVDGDGVLEWLDLSGYGNHGKIYGATLAKLIRDPVR
jgi:hypothetical protein